MKRIFVALFILALTFIAAPAMAGKCPGGCPPDPDCVFGEQITGWTWVEGGQIHMELFSGTKKSQIKKITLFCGPKFAATCNRDQNFPVVWGEDGVGRVTIPCKAIRGGKKIAFGLRNRCGCWADLRFIESGDDGFGAKYDCAQSRLEFSKKIVNDCKCDP